MVLKPFRWQRQADGTLRSWGLYAIVALSMGVACLADPLWGQVSPQPPTAVVPDKGNVSDRPISQPPAPDRPDAKTRPDTFYLRDQQGNLVPVLMGLTYEEFVEIYHRRDQGREATTPPPHSILEWTARGAAEDDRVELEVFLRIHTQVGGLARVPLGLGGAVLREEATYLGPAQQTIVYDAAERQYVLWLRGDAEADHELTLKMLVPLERQAGETRMSLRAPAATMSRMTLRVPLVDGDATIGGSASLVEKTVEDGQTEFAVVGLTEDFSMRWYADRLVSSPETSSLEAEGRIVVFCDGPDMVRSEAQLRVRSSGKLVESIQVQLPPGHELMPQSVPDYTVGVVREERAEASGEWVQVAEVKMREKTSGPTSIILRTQLTRPSEEAGKGNAAAMFSVLGALRQTGEVIVSADDQWAVSWDEGPLTRRISTPRAPELLARPVAAFQYFAQPCLLRVRVLPKQSTVHVEPAYHYHVTESQIELHARLAYQVRGAPISFVSLEMPDWTVTRVEPAQRVSDGLRMDQTKPLLIPLASPVTGDMLLDVYASRPLSKDATQLSLQLPDVHGNSSGRPVAVVTADERVQLTPRSGEMPEFSLIPVPDVWQGLLTGQAPFSFRARGSEGWGALELGYSRRATTPTVTVETEVHVTEQEAGIDQDFQYQIPFVPVEQLEFLVPRELLARKMELRWILDGESLDASRMREVDNASAGGAGRFMVRLPSPRLGPCRMTVKYAVPIETLQDGTPRDLKLPLVSPASWGRATESPTGTRHTIQVTATSPVAVFWPSDSPWSSQVRMAATEVGPRLVGETRLAQSQVVVRAALAKTTPRRSLYVERAFVQSWFTASRRYDRCAWRIPRVTDRLLVGLPKHVDPDDVRGMVNGKEVLCEEFAGGIMGLPLRADGHGDYRVELMYSAPRVDGLGRRDLELPVLLDVTSIGPTYWQVILPPQERIWQQSAPLISEQSWRWRGWFWSHEPRYAQRDLEEWAGVPHRPPPPPSCHSYVFSTLEWPARVLLRTVHQSWLNGLTASLTFLVGMLLLHVPFTRHPWVITAGLLTMATVAAWVPTILLHLGLGAAFGIMLTLMAGGLLWIMRRHSQQAVIVHGKVGGRLGPPVEPASHGSRVDVEAASVPTGEATTVSPLPGIIAGETLP